MSISVPLHRVGGDIALDFANTVSWRGTDRETDHIRTGDALLSWAADNSLLRTGVARAPVSGPLLRTAHDLRHAIRRVMEAVLAGEPAPHDRALILDILRRSLGSAKLIGTPAQIDFVDPADAVVGPIALATVNLLCGERLARLKMCPQEDCHWFFLDMTKNRSRRWCDMASCGNRAKATQHRRRHAAR
jgi:predicted RNA-binding Zn ribbon-like protein